MVKPTARLNLEPEDIKFITTALASSKKVEKLLASPAERDKILNDPDLFSYLMTNASMLNISLSLYFYILINQALKQVNIENAQVADYLASMLATFSVTKRVNTISGFHKKQYNYLVEIMSDIVHANSKKTFYLHSHMGNYCMFLVGLFPDHINHNTEYSKMAPNFSYYEHMGSSGYKNAANSHVARQWELCQTLQVLSTQFKTIRHALNYMVDSYLNIDGRANSVDHILRRVQGEIDRDKHIS